MEDLTPNFCISLEVFRNGNHEICLFDTLLFSHRGGEQHLVSYYKTGLVS